jgi:hypothetical protein
MAGPCFEPFDYIRIITIHQRPQIFGRNTGHATYAFFDSLSHIELAQQ